MTDLNVRAVITAVDRLTGPLAAMGGKVAGLQNRFNSAATAASGMGMAAGMAAGGLIYALTSGQKELDTALRQYQVVGNASDAARVQMRKTADELAVKLGMPQLDLIQGATEMLQAGLAPEDLMTKGADGVTLLQNMGEAAKVAGQPIAELATDLVTLAKSFGMKWGNAEERGKALKDLMGLAIVAPRLSPDSPAGHIRALKEFGPIASQLGMTPLEASALQNTLSSAGFREQLGGMGMKSILQRLLNPTKAAQAQMSISGFNFGRVMKNNLGMLSADKFVDALETGGLDAGGARGFIGKELTKAIAEGANLDILRFKSQLALGIAKKLGVKKGDAFNTAIIKAGVDDVIAGTGTGIDVRAFLQELQKLPTAAFKDVAGLHHASKMAVLKFQESLAQFERNMEQTAEQMPTAVSEGMFTKAQGWAYQLDRMSAAWTRFRNALWDNGAGDTFTGLAEKIGSLLNSLSTMDPKNIQALSTGLSTLAVGLGALAGASAGVWALARLGAILTGPAGQILMAGGALSALGLLNGRSQQTGKNGAIVGGQSDAMALLDSLQQLSSTVGSLMSTFEKLSGAQIDTSGMVSALGAVNQLVQEINAGLQSFDKWMKGDKSSTFGFGDGQFMGLKWQPETAFWNRGASGFGGADANAPARGSLGFWDTFKAGMMPGSGPNAALGQAGQLQQAPQIGPVTAKLEGSGTVTVNVKVDGPGQVTGVSASDDGKNIKLKTGGGMGDTNK